MFDVAIIGAGPVGMVAALALIRRGVRVALFEAYSTVPTANRAATTHVSTLTRLDELGLMPEILAQGLRADLFQWRDQVSGAVIAEYDFGLLADECPFPFVIQLEQHKLVNIIDARLRALSGLTYHRATQVTELAEHGDRVVLTAQNAEGPVVAEARYVIGCDGARSLVRKFMDVDFEGFTFDERFAVVTLRHDFAQSMALRLRNYLAHPESWVAVFKVPGEQGEGIWRTTYPLQQDLSADPAAAEDEVRRFYARYLPVALTAPITQLNTYNVHQRVAARFRKGRALLAGDAAHVNNPLGGLGLNSGIHDAVILADRLCAVLNGGDEGLLDLYDRQRRGPARQYVQAQSMQNKKMIEETAPAVRAANMAAMRATVADPAAHRAYVRRASLVQMLEDSLAIT
jgi:3-(3-hydroxy-phenyl)propionate hydroxylase